MVLYHSYLAILNQVTSHPVTALGHLQYLHLYPRVHEEFIQYACVCTTPLDTIDSDHTHHLPPGSDVVCRPATRVGHMLL